MPPASRKGRPGQRNPRYRPRDPKRARYYKASIAAASVFLCLAIVFPFWIDHVKRSRDRADIEASAEVSFVPPARQPAAAATPVKTPVGALPYSNMANAECQAYVQARCNALGIRPGVCGEIEGAAAKVPAGGGMKLCRESVEGRLRDAARFAGTGDEPGTDEGASEPIKPAAGAAVAPRAGTGQVAGEAGEEDEGHKDTQAAETDKDALTPAQKAENLEQIHLLVEELQRASQNYSTLPAAQKARFMELQKRVEADGSPELRQLYNTLLKQHGRTAWFDTGRAPLQAKESKRVEAGTMTGPAPRTTPEMDEVRRMMNEARREAGRPTGEPPSLGSSSPPTSIEPSAVEAAPARGL